MPLDGVAQARALRRARRASSTSSATIATARALRAACRLEDAHHKEAGEGRPRGGVLRSRKARSGEAEAAVKRGQFKTRSSGSLVGSSRCPANRRQNYRVFFFDLLRLLLERHADGKAAARGLPRPADLAREFVVGIVDILHRRRDRRHGGGTGGA